MIAFLEGCFPKKKIKLLSTRKLLKTSWPFYATVFQSFLWYNFAMDYPWLFISYGYCIVPLIDECFEHDDTNPDSIEEKEMENNIFFYLLPMYLVAILNWMFFLKSMKYFAEVDITQVNYFKFIGMTYLCTVINSNQFVLAH